MSPHRIKAFDYALRAMRRDARRGDGANGVSAAPGAGRRKTRREPSVARRELDSFRRSQGLPYWHHDQH